MKISNASEPLRPDRLLPNAGDARPTASKSGEPVVQSAKVQLSDLASRMSQLESKFGGEFDAKKVSELRAAISEGRFKVNPEAVADKLLASAAEMAGKK